MNRFDGVNVLINVAGIHKTTPIDSLTVEDLQLLFSVNLVGTALFCREALRHHTGGSHPCLPSLDIA